MNITEGATTDDVVTLEANVKALEADLKVFKNLYCKSTGLIVGEGEKNKSTRIGNLNFYSGSTDMDALNALISKYNAVDNTITMELTVDQVINKLTYKIVSLDNTLFKIYYSSAMNKSVTKIDYLTWKPGSTSGTALRRIIQKYNDLSLTSTDPLNLYGGLSYQQILDRFQLRLSQLQATPVKTV